VLIFIFNQIQVPIKILTFDVCYRFVQSRQSKELYHGNGFASE